ncbi:SGNH/GDSL hydrolase family protein [Arthrobacter sp. I2-34]|uniref:SGNH/GDSL hydrolase family protein n=1 Tax=Arthrobacter hankyongi TaxID=2904801 RepID=A0ABS9LB99_9MICC|nr:SGNH/GDSL hydrolase family protein [Arthrobacter hankyongi]MCG2623959.1 SGNH/GDSL hydrolase family protein [Arthrobacter hankyongi]
MARWLALLTLGFLAAVLAGCASPTGGSSPTPTGAWSLAALGDSVPAGVACDCTPYPQLSASDLSSPDGPAVKAANEAVGGFTTVDVLHQLTDASAAIDSVKAARLVEIEVGANDVAYSSSCGTEVACYLPKLTDLRTNLHDIVDRVHELTAGHAVNVVLLDYWSVWLGGQYASQQGQAYVDAAATVTDEVNTVIKDIAAQTGSAYVDLRAAFKGPDYSYDETHYLAADGDHPNAAGHQKIAAALAEVVQRPQGT